jgi:di/tricarboxylate transporter
MQQDTRKLLTTGSALFGSGVLCVALLFGVFGGATRWGPHTNGGWLVLVMALGLLPLGLLISALGLAKLIGEKTRS